MGAGGSGRLAILEFLVWLLRQAHRTVSEASKGNRSRIQNHPDNLEEGSEIHMAKLSTDKRQGPSRGRKITRGPMNGGSQLEAASLLTRSWGLGWVGWHKG